MNYFYLYFCFKCQLLFPLQLFRESLTILLPTFASFFEWKALTMKLQEFYNWMLVLACTNKSPKCKKLTKTLKFEFKIMKTFIGLNKINKLRNKTFILIKYGQLRDKSIHHHKITHEFNGKTQYWNNCRC